MKIKYFFYSFLFFLVLSSNTIATSIAVSPATIKLNSNQERSSFILLNPNSEEVQYTVTTSSEKIQLSDIGGSLSPQEKKTIPFTTNNLETNEYIVTSFNSKDTINPSISIKITPLNIKQPTNIVQATNIPKSEIQANPSTSNKNLITGNTIREINQETPTNTKSQTFLDKTTLFLVAIVLGLLAVYVFVKPSNEKYRIRHIGQNLRMFINKLMH